MIEERETTDDTDTADGSPFSMRIRAIRDIRGQVSASVRR
jgi:hypothetical protein